MRNIINILKIKLLFGISLFGMGPEPINNETIQFNGTNIEIINMDNLGLLRLFVDNHLDSTKYMERIDFIHGNKPVFLYENEPFSKDDKYYYMDIDNPTCKDLNYLSLNFNEVIKALPNSAVYNFFKGYDQRYDKGYEGYYKGYEGYDKGYKSIVSKYLPRSNPYDSKKIFCQDIIFNILDKFALHKYYSQSTPSYFNLDYFKEQERKNFKEYIKNTMKENDFLYFPSQMYDSFDSKSIIERLWSLIVGTDIIDEEILEEYLLCLSQSETIINRMSREFGTYSLEPGTDSSEPGIELGINYGLAFKIFQYYNPIELILGPLNRSKKKSNLNKDNLDKMAPGLNKLHRFACSYKNLIISLGHRYFDKNKSEHMPFKELQEGEVKKCVEKVKEMPIFKLKKITEIFLI